MNPIQEFGAFQAEGYAKTTRRVYLSAAKKAIMIAGKTPENCATYEELLALLRKETAEKRLPKGLRIAPFLRFLEARIQKNSWNDDRQQIRTWVADRVEEATKAFRRSSLCLRRDLAMLAGLCVAPERGSPREWPRARRRFSSRARRSAGGACWCRARQRREA